MSKVEVVRRDYATGKTEVLHEARTVSAAVRWLKKEGWKYIGGIDDEPTRVLYEIEEDGVVLGATAPCTVSTVEEITGLWSGSSTRSVCQVRREMRLLPSWHADLVRNGTTA